MKIIEEVIVPYIRDELADARKYALEAVTIKREYPSLAKASFDISQQEIGHATMYHNEGVKLIDAYRKEHGDAPAPMQAIYDFLHMEFIQQEADVRRLWDMYKS